MRAATGYTARAITFLSDAATTPTQLVFITPKASRTSVSETSATPRSLRMKVERRVIPVLTPEWLHLRRLLIHSIYSSNKFHINSQDSGEGRDSEGGASYDSSGFDT